MKLKSYQLNTFLPKTRTDYNSCLLYGADLGAIQNLAQDIIKQKKAELVILTPDILRVQPTAFWDEVASLGLFSAAPRLIWFKNPPDSFAKEFDAYLKKPCVDVFVLMTSETLNTRSALVKLCDSAPACACFGCYAPTENELKQRLASTLLASGYQISADALGLLAGLTGADSALTRNEINKLMTYMGDKKKIEIADVQVCVDDGSAALMDDLIYHILIGDDAPARRAFTRLMKEGVTPVAVIRLLMCKLAQLAQIAAKIRQGIPTDAAIKSTLFFVPSQYMPHLRQAVTIWTPPRLKDGLVLLVQAEQDCKSSLPAELMCNRALTSLSFAARKFSNFRR